MAGIHELAVDTVHEGTLRCLQVDLNPPAACQLLGLPLSEPANTTVGLDELPDLVWAELDRRLTEVPDWSHCFELVERTLLHCLAEHPGEDPEVRRAWQQLHRSHGGIPISQLAAQVGWSRRHLTSRFHAQVGLAPKAVGRLPRFSHALRLLASHPATIAEVAAEAGYADHSHLVREFRRLTGGTPTELPAGSHLSNTGPELSA